MGLSDQRASELRQLFFESAQEIVQALNHEGLRLEQHPGDLETLRNIRRAVHTLKGDSAVCGYREFTELAHQLEDVLDPEQVKAQRGVAEVVLGAADTFEAMLRAYRENRRPPAAPHTLEDLRRKMDALRPKQKEQASQAAPQAGFQPRFPWSEYERLSMANAHAGGRKVYQIALVIDPQCAMRSAAAQLIKRALHELGSLLALHERLEATAGGPQEVVAVEAAVAGERDREWVLARCKIPSLVSEVVVETWAPEPPAEAVSAVEEKLPDVIASGALDAAVPEAASAEPTLRVPAERVDLVMDLVGEMIIAKSMLQQSLTDLTLRLPKDPLRAQLADAVAFQTRLLHELQQAVMKIRMVEVRQLFRRVPRIVRDTARREGKEVALLVSGEKTELDKTILDALAEPLAHMVRNAVAHGIEPPAEREKAGKPRAGTIRLNAFHQASQVVIEISDDGHGIDAARLKQRALDRKLISRDEAERMSETEALDLMFQFGISTAAEVTEVSGRGIGMDVVRDAVEKLKGTVSVQSLPGQGATFQLRLPLTLAIIRALLFRAAGRLYAVPLGSVLEIARATEADVHRVEAHEVMRLREQILPLLRMQRLGGGGGGRKRMFVIVVAVGDRKFGLVVDRTLGEEELVVKAFDDRLVSTDLVSGASILGDGAVVLILNLAAVVERLSAQDRRTLSAGEPRVSGAGA